MSHGGTFDRLDAGRDFCVGWREHHACVPSNTTSAQLFGIDAGLHSGVVPGGVGDAQSAKASSTVLMLSLLLRRHAVPLKSPATKSIC